MGFIRSHTNWRKHMKRRYFLAAIGAISLSIAACSDEKKSDPATSYEKFRERLQNIINDLRVESVSPA
jgi:hypothetical protein